MNSRVLGVKKLAAVLRGLRLFRLTKLGKSVFLERDAFLRVGGYDERFGVGSTYGAAEGTDLLIRLLPTVSPRQAYYSCRVKFIHPNKRSDYSMIGEERAFNYARGLGALFAKWPMPAQSPATFRYVAASPFGQAGVPWRQGANLLAPARGIFFRLSLVQEGIAHG